MYGANWGNGEWRAWRTFPSCSSTGMCPLSCGIGLAGREDDRRSRGGIEGPRKLDNGVSSLLFSPACTPYAIKSTCTVSESMSGTMENLPKPGDVVDTKVNLQSTWTRKLVVLTGL